mmetsp:Transcript_293/g.297  ORF Transcript_293/g.297 Transcript_293/m.297 type:complete len:167 (+) Transcript_293:41-541(+)
MALWVPRLAVALLTSTLVQARASEPVQITDSSTLSKLASPGDAGAVRTSALLQGAHGAILGLSVVAEATNDFMFGSSSDKAQRRSVGESSFDFAAGVSSKGLLGAHASGSFMGAFGAVQHAFESIAAAQAQLHTSLADVECSLIEVMQENTAFEKLKPKNCGKIPH